MMNQLLRLYDISPSDYSPVYVNYSDGFTALADGNADAAIINTAPPVAGIQELGIRKDFRLLNVEDEKRAAFLEKYPFYSQGRISKETYDLAEDVPTVGSVNLIIIRKDLEEDLVYDMIKSVYENLDVLRASHPSARVIAVENGPHPSLPLHPGAERYFREVGVLK